MLAAWALLGEALRRRAGFLHVSFLGIGVHQHSTHGFSFPMSFIGGATFLFLAVQEKKRCQRKETAAQ